MKTSFCRIDWVLAVFVLVPSALSLFFLGINKRADINFALRNPDYPATFIKEIHVDLGSPNHSVRLVWSGAMAPSEPTGPFHSSPGMGHGCVDCNDPTTSNQSDSNCTPKGQFIVAETDDRLESYPDCRYVTVIDVARSIALHSHSEVPNYPASHGCIRLDEYAAQVIHNNSVVGVTSVDVAGSWTRPPSMKACDDIAAMNSERGH